MIGARTVMQEALFYSFSLEAHVPQSHLLRAVGHFVDLSGALARKCILTWPIAGSAALALTELCRIIRPSPRTGTAGSVTAICCGKCSR